MQEKEQTIQASEKKNAFRSDMSQGACENIMKKADDVFARASTGQIQISSDVVATVAGTAAAEVEGVVFAPRRLGQKRYGRNVSVQITDGKASFDITLCVAFGAKIQEVATNVQKVVKNAVESMTGLTVQEVNINVTAVKMSKKAADNPIE